MYSWSLAVPTFMGYCSASKARGKTTKVTERDELLASIAATTADYREGDLAAPTPAHVERWISQFEAAARLPILREMDHVLRRR